MWLDAREWARAHLEPNTENVPTVLEISTQYRETISAYIDEVRHGVTRYRAARVLQCAIKEGYKF